MGLVPLRPVWCTATLCCALTFEIVAFQKTTPSLIATLMFNMWVPTGPGAIRFRIKVVYLTSTATITVVWPCVWLKKAVIH